MAKDRVYLLAQEAYNKMRGELAHREGELREGIAHKTAVAHAEGDLSENGGYQAAREVQSKNEGHITELTIKLCDSEIIENAPGGIVGEGSVVTIKPNGDEMTYVLSSRDTVAGTDCDITAPDSPIGRVIEGAKVGDIVSYTAPDDHELSVTVRAIKPLT